MATAGTRANYSRFMRSFGRCAWRGLTAGARVAAIRAATNTNPKFCEGLLRN
jgi:hypothetical protein